MADLKNPKTSAAIHRMAAVGAMTIVLAATMAATAMCVSRSMPSGSEGRGRALGGSGRGSGWRRQSGRGGLLHPAPLLPVATGICGGGGGDGDGCEVSGCSCGGGCGIDGGSG